MTDERVSQEAHSRVREELAEAVKRAEAAERQVADLSAVVGDFGRFERLHDYFDEKGVKHPRRWARFALPHTRDLEDLDGIPERLGELLSDEDLQRLQDPVPAAAPAAVGDENPPETRSPGFVQPNPGAAGAAPRTEALRVGSAELERIAEAGGPNAVRAAVADGRVAISQDVKDRHGL